MRRQEGKPQIGLPKRGENKFFFLIIVGVEIAYILMNRAGKLMTVHEAQCSMCIEQIYI